LLRNEGLQLRSVLRSDFPKELTILLDLLQPFLGCFELLACYDRDRLERGPLLMMMMLILVLILIACECALELFQHTSNYTP